MANNPSPTMIERLLDAIVDQLTPEAAEVFTNLYAPDDVRARIDALVEKLMQRGLEPAERDEYDGLMHVVHTISMIQDRIDARLGGPPAAGPTATYIESVDSGPAVIPRPVGGAAAPQFDGLEAMLEDLDENLRPGRKG